MQIYQLSRLLHDRHKDLYDYLVDNGIPTLYAAPWFLTLFSSTFPMGFVARVFGEQNLVSFLMTQIFCFKKTSKTIAATPTPCKPSYVQLIANYILAM